MNVTHLPSATATLVDQLDTDAYTPRNTTENDQYVAMMQRMIRALERRAIDDPAILAQVLLLAQQLSEVVNVVVATSAEKYSRDPYSSPSMAECAAILGIKKQSASDRRKLGERTIAERLAAAGAVSFSAAKRERAARAAAAQHAEQAAPVWAEVRQLRAV